ncbi:MAG: DUF7010 family protein, partial [Clostridium sp.]
MNINELKNELSIKCKSGLAFLLSGTFVWCIIFIIFLLPYEIKTKNILTFFCTGIMFPTSILISRVIKSEWKLNDNPLGMLGLYLNLAQFMYFPILFFSFSKNPEQMIIFFAVITGAHLFPYGWFYNTRSFMIIAPAISVVVAFIGYNIEVSNNWAIPLVVIIFLIILDTWIY